MSTRDGAVWVFGYGSLVWRPDFPYDATRDGWLHGWVRRFWQGSPDHRGTPNAPGRVATLVASPGHRVFGRLYRVHPGVLGALDFRERAGYTRHSVDVTTTHGTTLTDVLLYVAGEGNPSWLGPASLDQMARQVRTRRGPSGTNREYVVRLASALVTAGVSDPHVEALAAAVAGTPPAWQRPAPMTAIPETVALFDDWANQGRAEGMEEGHLPRALIALARIDVRAGDRILDLGCGNGWATRLLRQRAGDDGSAVGVDASVPMVERARVASAGAPGLTFQRGVFETLPFDDASFDHVFSFEALYYSSDLSQSLAEIRRVLRPGGSLTIGTDHYLENEDSHSWSADLSVPMEMMSEAQWGERVRLAGFESVETFRCLDPRPVDPTWSAAKQATVRHFRTVVGTLGVYAV